MNLPTKQLDGAVDVAQWGKRCYFEFEFIPWSELLHCLGTPVQQRDGIFPLLALNVALDGKKQARLIAAWKIISSKEVNGTMILLCTVVALCQPKHILDIALRAVSRKLQMDNLPTMRLPCQPRTVHSHRNAAYVRQTKFCLS